MTNYLCCQTVFTKEPNNPTITLFYNETGDVVSIMSEDKYETTMDGSVVEIEPLEITENDYKILVKTHQIESQIEETQQDIGRIENLNQLELFSYSN